MERCHLFPRGNDGTMKKKKKKRQKQGTMERWLAKCLYFFGRGKKKKEGIFVHFWGPLVRPPDDWNDGT